MSLIKRGVDASIIKKFQEGNSTQRIKSRFGFLNCHFGLRKGLPHGILGTPGSGKTSLLRSIIADTAEAAKTLLYLTEESRVQYQAKLAPLKPNMDNLFFISEKDFKTDSFHSLDELLNYLFENLLQYDIEVFIWDNLTTSKIYESLKPDKQGYLFKKIQDFCDDNGIYFLYVAHTKQGISDSHGKLIEGEDTRGSAYPFNMSPYFYILQRFTIGTTVYAFVHVRKHRFHDITQKFYLLNFKDGIYYDDRVLEFSNLNTFFKQRNYLGQGGEKKKSSKS